MECFQSLQQLAHGFWWRQREWMGDVERDEQWDRRIAELHSDHRRGEFQRHARRLRRCMRLHAFANQFFIPIYRWHGKLHCLHEFQLHAHGHAVGRMDHDHFRWRDERKWLRRIHRGRQQRHEYPDGHDLHQRAGPKSDLQHHPGRSAAMQLFGGAHVCLF